jgi:hypothetical protein
MAVELKDVDDIINIIAEILAKGWLNDVMKYIVAYIQDIHPEYIEPFKNFITAFRGYIRMTSPIVRQLMAVIDSKYQYYNIYAVLEVDADLILQYFVENSSFDIDELLLISGFKVWSRCAKYLYENEQTRDTIVEHLRGIYNYTGDIHISARDINKYIKLSVFVIDNNIVEPHVGISGMVRYGIDIGIIESFILKYNIQEYPGCIELDACSDERYTRDFIALYMKYFDNVEVFTDIIMNSPYGPYVDETFEKYNMASLITKKFSIVEIYDVETAFYLITKGICQFDETTFWVRYGEDQYIDEISNEVLQIMYDNSTCSVCLAININILCMSPDILRHALLYLGRLPQKLCSGCHGIEAKKLTKS